MKSRRRELDLTQRQLAARFYALEEVDVKEQHQVQMSRYENGHRWPDEESLDRLALALECDRGRLVGTKEGQADG